MTPLSVGNHFVKGISLGYHAVEGAVKNEEGNRFKSSAVSVYESTPFSYVEKGEEIVIPKNNIFILNFKVKGEENEEDKPNYEFTPLENPAVNSTEPTAVPLPEILLMNSRYTLENSFKILYNINKEERMVKV